MSIRSEYKQRKHLALLAAGVVLLICWPWPAARGEETEATIVNDLGEFPRNVLRQYCLDCHSGTDPEGDFDMDPIVTGNIASLRSAAWRKIAVALKNGQMPPGDAVQLSEAERQQAVRSIEDQLAVEDCNGEQDPGRVTIRRLNHREYRNTIRDLLGVDFIHSDDFPADDVGYGFDNIGDVLSVAPLTLEKYLKSAERVLDRSIVDRVAVEPATQYFDPQQLKRAPEMKSEPGWLTNNGVLFQQATIPRNGRYLLRVWAWQTKAGPDTARMAIKLNGRSLQEFDVAARKENAEKYEVSVTIEKGTHRIAAEFLNDYWNPKAEKHRDRNLYVDSIEVIGPNDTQAPELPATHRRIFFVQPDKNTTQQEAAATIIRQFAARAFRRPVQEDELQRLVKLYQLADQDGQPFEASVKLALTGVLVSPHFLFRVEIDREPSGPFGAYRISDYELASRLSYFLWSTMPDDELTRLASDNRLHKPQVLDQQVARMLQDPKSSALVDNFAGQWLQLRTLAEVQPDVERFPFDDQLRSAIRKEASSIFAAVMREDRSVLELIDSDYTFLNERLARHYGIEGVTGEKMRRVQLSDRRRGGVLTTAAVLTVTSDPARTSPVKRGKWILEQFLGTPAPPPLPDVPALDEDSVASAGLSLREQLQRHTADARCATCHRRLDPMGFALENYDAVGRWRDRDDNQPIDSSAQLPDGTRFDGPIGLKDILNSHKDDFVRCLSEKMLTYALGRGLEHYDHCAIRDLSQNVATNNYRFSALIAATARSTAFQYRRTASIKEVQDD